MKKCTSCRETKPLTLFYANKASRDGRSSWCIDCSRKKSREYVMKHRYGLSKEGYDTLMAMQDYACAACGRPFGEGKAKPEIDHDHKCCPGTSTCGKCVRGILCAGCNNMAGGIEYNLEHLDDVLRYLTFFLMKKNGEIPSDTFFSKRRIDDVRKYIMTGGK